MGKNSKNLDILLESAKDIWGINKKTNTNMEEVGK